MAAVGLGPSRPRESLYIQSALFLQSLLLPTYQVWWQQLSSLKVAEKSFDVGNKVV